MACALLADFVCTLELECLALYEAQGRTDVVTGIVGVVAVLEFPQVVVGLVGNNGPLLAVEGECYNVAVVIVLNESIRTVRHQHLTLRAVSVVDKSQASVELVGIIADTRSGNSPAIDLNRSPGLGKSHVLLFAVIPLGNRYHNCHVLFARSVIKCGSVVSGLGLVVVIVHEAVVIGQVLLTVYIFGIDEAL